MTELNNEWLEKIFKPAYFREYKKLRRKEPRVQLYLYSPGQTQIDDEKRSKKIHIKLQPWVTQFCKRKGIETKFNRNEQITFFQE